MLKVTPRHIESYTKCPKRTWFNWSNIPELSLNLSAVTAVIKQVHLYQSRKNTIMPWRHVFSLLERELNKQLKRYTDPVYKYKLTTALLSQLYTWYHDHYLEKYFDDGISNFPVRLTLAPNLWFHDEVDLITVGSKVRLFDFVEASQQDTYASYTPSRVYNSFFVQARLWGFWKFTETQPTEYVRLVLGSQALKMIRISIRESMLKRTEEVLRYVIRGMKDKIWYPSFSEQCNTCPFTQRCHI
jgi:CRISPR/Cas system-associated exonuclease Cas4 (RecB family)